MESQMVCSAATKLNTKLNSSLQKVGKAAQVTAEPELPI